MSTNTKPVYIDPNEIFYALALNIHQPSSPNGPASPAIICERESTVVLVTEHRMQPVIMAGRIQAQLQAMLPTALRETPVLNFDTLIALCTSWRQNFSDTIPPTPRVVHAMWNFFELTPPESDTVEVFHNMQAGKVAEFPTRLVDITKLTVWTHSWGLINRTFSNTVPVPFKTPADLKGWKHFSIQEVK